MAHPETRFIQAIHRQLKAATKKQEFYCAKLQVSGNNGWPDCYYSGEHGDLWIEYKWVSERDFPVHDTSIINVNLSANQTRWLNGRHGEGRSVCVIVGSTRGHVLLHHPFPKSISKADFIGNAVDNSVVVGYILGKTTKYHQ